MKYPQIITIVSVLYISMQIDCSATDSEIEAKLASLEKQNLLLMRMIEKQQVEINGLKEKLVSVDTENIRQSDEIEELQDSGFSVPALAPTVSGNSSILISGEAGIAFHAGQANTIFPNEEFRVDEARIFVEAAVARNVFFFTELEMFSREENANMNLRAAEIYFEVENLFAMDEWDRGFNLRAGRLDIPFGEEYLTRDVMDNILISHSVADIWGIDEGIELFGEFGSFDYALAVQNGSRDALRDWTSDKSITARLGFNPSNNLRLSASYMDTGAIDPSAEVITEVWFGNAVFRSIGSAATTSFDAELTQGDIRYSWDNGQLAASYGQAWYSDNDPLANNSRDFEFWSIEVQQGLTDQFYAGVRYSRLDADGGYPIAGMGDRNTFFFAPFNTDQLHRLSLGFTYWPFEDLVLKLDYTFENGDHSDGSKRENSDQLSAEAGVRF
ncbi:MAG: hypothetical protein KJT03_12545 [Verrucomicrobiae bacterium]|nr:hypothetical protein [Verrucomicrobiae bacterium]